MDLGYQTKIISKKIFDTKTAVAIILGLFIFSISVNESFAAQSERQVVGGQQNTLVYRDVFNTSPTPEPVVSLDKSFYLPGDTAVITVDDFNANLDLAQIDTTSAIVNSQTVQLTETDVNSHIFVGSFIVQSTSLIDYLPNPAESPRASVDLDVDVGGDVVLGDVLITDEDIANMCFFPATHAFELTTDGAALGDGSTITMSFANALLYPLDDPLYLQMYYKAPGGSWQIITPNFFILSDLSSNLSVPGATSSFNFVDKSITNNPDASGFVTNGYSGPITEGQFILGIETSCGGGGGGGLIRPGLVLNLLAGIPGLGGGIDVSPPSLQFGSSNTQDGFGGILVTDNNNSFPLVIDDKGYYLPTYSTTIDPVKVNTGQDVSLTLTFLESTGVEHVAIHFVDENNDVMSDSDAAIIFDKAGGVTKSDPQGILADDVAFSTSKDGNKYSFNFGFSFDQPANRHFMITAWDNNKNSGNTKVFNAFAVSGNPIPDEGVGHMIYLDLGAFYIATEGIIDTREKLTVAQPVIEYDYPDSVGRTERHDGIIHEIISDEKTRANHLMSEKFNLDTETFAADDNIKPDDTKRASELSWSHVGHKIRDFTLTPQENKELIKELAWKEHLKAQKILDSLYSVYHN